MGAGSPIGQVAWSSGDGVVEWAYATFRGELEGRLDGLVRDHAVAEELAQETFLRLHTEVQAGRTPGNVRAWLHRVAGNLVTSRGRHVQVAARHAPRLVAVDEGASTEEIALRHDEGGRIVLALAELRPRERAVLVMAASGLSGPEIATRIGRTPIATRTLLCRARLHLREHVEALERSA